MRRTAQLITLCLLVLVFSTIPAFAQDGNNIVIQPGEIGVVFDRLSGDLLEPLEPGTHNINPVRYTVTIHSTRQQSAPLEDRLPVEVRTRDGQIVNLSAEVFYQIDPTQVNVIHARWGTEYGEMLLPPLVRGLIREVASLYDAEQLYGQDRALFAQNVEDALTEALDGEHLMLTQFLLTDVQFSDEYTAALEARIVMENQHDIAELEVQRLRTLAEGQRDAAIIEAEGDAQAMILAAEAQAEVLRILAAQQLEYLQQLAPLVEINPELLHYEIARLYSESGQLIIVPAGTPLDLEVDPAELPSGDDDE